MKKLPNADEVLTALDFKLNEIEKTITNNREFFFISCEENKIVNNQFEIDMEHPEADYSYSTALNFICKSSANNLNQKLNYIEVLKNSQHDEDIDIIESSIK